MVLLDPILIGLALIIVFIGAAAQGAMGMGFGQICAAGLVWIHPELVPTTVIVMAIVVASLGAIRERGSIDVGQLGIAISGRVAGALATIPVLLLVGASSRGFDLLFAVLILIAVAISLLRSGIPLNNLTLAVAGFSSGLMGTITAVGAPPMGLVYQGAEVVRARSTLNAFFAIGAPVSLVVLYFAGRLSMEHLVYAGILAPGFMIGLYCSRFLHGFVDQRFRYVILGFTAVSALALIARSLV